MTFESISWWCSDGSFVGKDGQWTLIAGRGMMKLDAAENIVPSHLREDRRARQPGAVAQAIPARPTIGQR